MTENRQWFNVGVVKLPEAQRDVARSVFAGHPDRFYDIIGADTPDDHDRWPVGSHTAYSALLTEREAEQFARASNARYVEPDNYNPDVTTLSPLLPRPRAQRYVQAEVAVYPSLTGTGTLVGQIDEGTTAAMRAEKNITLVSRALFTTTQPTGEIWPGNMVHGCLVAGTCVPYGGKMLDAFAVDADGGIYDSQIASAVTWLCTHSAQVVNMSIALGNPTSVLNDAFNQAASLDVVFFISAGNEGQRMERYPASLSETLPYVHSIMSMDMSIDQASSFSNYGPWFTGTAPGELMYTTTSDGSIVEWAGTSASSPHVAQLAARIMSAGVSARQAGAALKATLRDIGLGEKQGGGLYSMQAALRWLGKEPAVMVTGQVNPQRGAALPVW